MGQLCARADVNAEAMALALRRSVPSLGIGEVLEVMVVRALGTLVLLVFNTRFLRFFEVFSSVFLGFTRVCLGLPCLENCKLWLVAFPEDSKGFLCFRMTSCEFRGICSWSFFVTCYDTFLGCSGFLIFLTKMPSLRQLFVVFSRLIEYIQVWFVRRSTKNSVKSGALGFGPPENLRAAWASEAPFLGETKNLRVFFSIPFDLR